MNINFDIIAPFLGFLGLVASLYTFMQRQKQMIKKQSSQFERFKFDIEQIKLLTSNEKMAEYHKLTSRVEDNTKRIDNLEVTLREEIKGLSEKIDSLILNLNKK